MKHYLVELRIREAGDVGDARPVSGIVELPLEHERAVFTAREQHVTVGGAVDWALELVRAWMRRQS